jgi:hypothetical protein
LIVSDVTGPGSYDTGIVSLVIETIIVATDRQIIFVFEQLFLSGYDVRFCLDPGSNYDNIAWKINMEAQQNATNLELLARTG